MEFLEFTWDERKNTSNKKKHKISFEEAKTAFYDKNARLIPDSEHSISEDRYILLGISDQMRVLIVCHCYRENDGIIRVISARKANKSEQQQYWEFAP